MEFKSRYKSHQPDEHGYINYSAEEHGTWALLYERQVKLLPGRACDEYMNGLDHLVFTQHAIPQLPDVNKRLKELSGWQVFPVPALISIREFFELLASKKFPVATFIRVREELDYIKEPDIFHELFGHCPMIANPMFADFLYKYACQFLQSPEEDWPLLGRLFWFTVEFGLITTPKGLRIYGGGILSSIGETPYCVESSVPLRALFSPVAVFRTPYRIDILQPIYFVIDSYQMLYELISSNTRNWIKQARELGEFPPFFPVEEGHPAVQINVC